ncbi:hypothetical protein GT012_02550 [Listeria monocytogenes]|uniref:Bacterial regulatory protein, luxR family n=10 Tax=Listeria monocytogenes TaxID=1639 RepID=A0A1B2LQY7_LISMN|nr:hypothetical protein [Listeria monocytogenes]MBC1519926.1 hypothetical protein [Listeria welshimeri]AMD28288.1 hypothetical protein KO07_12280 [Listeria monocytogenes]AOA49253.1 Bacterial regulatory protein, luxR family [Listeria monocytogenes]AQP80885.1 hypothetical protein B0X21_14270 [Listeria monocytogenes]AQP86653.1 hypothetical protein B0X17_13620 [Listeria monocytogenes]
MRKNWTDEEIRVLQNNYEYVDTEIIANFLNRSYHSIKNKATRLGISKNYDWTEDEDIYLEYFVYENDDNISKAAEFLGRTKDAVINRLVKLRKRDSSVSFIRRPWTKKEDEILKNNYIIMSNDQLAERLRRTKASVAARKVLLGLTNKHMSKEDDKMIRHLGNQGYTIKEISAEMNLSYCLVKNYIRNHRINYRRESKNEMNGWRKEADATYSHYINSKKIKEEQA